MSTPRSTNPETAIKRIITAALDQRNPSDDLRYALNHYLTLKEHPLRLREDTIQEEPWYRDLTR